MRKKWKYIKLIFYIKSILKRILLYSVSEYHLFRYNQYSSGTSCIWMSIYKLTYNNIIYINITHHDVCIGSYRVFLWQCVFCFQSNYCQKSCAIFSNIILHTTNAHIGNEIMIQKRTCKVPINIFESNIVMERPFDFDGRAMIIF